MPNAAFNVGPVAEQLWATLQSTLAANGGSLPLRVEAGVQAAPEGAAPEGVSPTTWAKVPIASSPRRLVLLAGDSQGTVGSGSVKPGSPRVALMEEDAVSVAASDRSLGESVPTPGPSPNVDVIPESVRGTGSDSGAWRLIWMHLTVVTVHWILVVVPEASRSRELGWSCRSCDSVSHFHHHRWTFRRRSPGRPSVS